jgi:hypothetical protein
VSDPEQRAVRCLLQHGLQDGVGRRRVKVAGRFVENEDRAVGQQGPGHAEALPLSAGDRMPPGRDHGIETELELVQPRAQPQPPEQLDDLLVGSVRGADAEVGAKRGREKGWLLRAPGDQRPDELWRQRPDVRAVDGQPPGGQVDKAQQSEHDRGLT